MKCYFSAKPESTDSMNPSEKVNKEKVLISFAIPDLGVLFRTHYRCAVDECTYIILLKLLKFIASNPKVFDNQKIEILSHDPGIVYQVNQKKPCDQRLEKLNDLALVYKSKLRYSLNWIPLKENKAEKGLPDRPKIKSEVPLNFSELDDSLRKRTGPGPNSRPAASKG